MTAVSQSYFESLYSEQEDPWSFATSPYELRKYALSVAALPNRRYRNAFEPGCSIGVLSEKLSQRCDHLLSTDIVETALERARERLRRCDNVRVERLAIPNEWPNDTFDLVVLSEIAYYFERTTLNDLMRLVVDTTREGAHVLGVHWRGTTNYPLSGDEAHEVINATPELRCVTHHEEREFVLDVWERGR